MGVGTHWQALTGEPMQASLFAHGVHRVASPHPLLASVGTHLSPHFLVPAPQTPMTHELP